MDGLHLVTAAVFALGAMVAGRAGQATAGAERRFLLVLAAALGLAAFEKVFRLVDRFHEGLHRLGAPDPPYLNGIDDAVWLSVAAVAAVFLAAHLQVIRGRPRLRAAILAAGCLAAGSIGIDAFGPAGGALTVFEDVLELGMALALAFAASQGEETTGNRQRPATTPRTLP